MKHRAEKGQPGWQDLKLLHLRKDIKDWMECRIEDAEAGEGQVVMVGEDMEEADRAENNVSQILRETSRIALCASDGGSETFVRKCIVHLLTSISTSR